MALIACQAHNGHTASPNNRCQEAATKVAVSALPPFSTPVPLTVSVCDQHAEALLEQGWNVVMGVRP